MSFNQGDIIKFNFSPTEGHEQSGYRPALVVSKTVFNKRTGQAIVCPITTREKPYPTRILLDGSAETKGYVICEHLKTIDVKARNPKFIERFGGESLEKVLDIVKMIF